MALKAKMKKLESKVKRVASKAVAAAKAKLPKAKKKARQANAAEALTKKRASAKRQKKAGVGGRDTKPGLPAGATKAATARQSRMPLDTAWPG